MNILFCGLGSIGQRQARLIQQKFNHQLFALRSQSKGNHLNIPEFSKWDELNNHHFDIAFITNPTHLHIKTALECAKRGMNLFLEKPIDVTADGLDELIDITAKKQLTAYVAYPLRFHPLIQKTKQWLENKQILHARFVCSSYLPDWRPGQDHQKIYSSYKAQGGGVLLDISHEIDLCDYLLGPIEKISGTAGRASQITVDSEDFADLIINQKGFTSNIHLSYFGQNNQRFIDIDTNQGSCQVDLITNSFTSIVDKKTENETIEIDRDEIYLNQLVYFFDNLQNRDLNNNLKAASKLFRQLLDFRKNI